MKTLISSTSIGLAWLLSSSLVLANPVNNLIPSPENQNKVNAKQCDREQGFEHKLDTLKTALKLNPEQEDAWTTWSEKIKADNSDAQAKHADIDTWKDLPALERMENRLKLAKEHVVKEEVRLAATKAFYDTLISEQRQIFDKEFNFPHHQRLGKHGKHNRPGHSM